MSSRPSRYSGGCPVRLNSASGAVPGFAQPAPNGWQPSPNRTTHAGPLETPVSNPARHSDYALTLDQRSRIGRIIARAGTLAERQQAKCSREVIAGFCNMTRTLIAVRMAVSHTSPGRALIRINRNERDYAQQMREMQYWRPLRDAGVQPLRRRGHERASG